MRVNTETLRSDAQELMRASDPARKDWVWDGRYLRELAYRLIQAADEIDQVRVSAAKET